jgi:hypothetical protein
MADMKFLDRLRTFDRDSISDKVLKKIRSVTKKPEFNIEQM